MTDFADIIATGLAAADIGAATTGALAAHTNATSGVHGVAGAVVGTSDTQTLTNKTLTSPTISAPTVNGVVTGGTGWSFSSAGKLHAANLLTGSATVAVDGSNNYYITVPGSLAADQCVIQVTKHDAFSNNVPLFPTKLAPGGGTLYLGNTTTPAAGLGADSGTTVSNGATVYYRIIEID